ncbi:hypothetical protein EV360DRAFT_21896, partial [Lentinula raphanica]
TGLSVHHVGECFQHTGTTISIHFRVILFTLSSPEFYNRWVKPPTAESPVPNRIQDEPKWSPFFDSVLGAIDGPHINCIPSATNIHLARNHK